MKTKLLTIFYILTSSILSAQNRDNILGPAESGNLVSSLHRGDAI